MKHNKHCLHSDGYSISTAMAGVGNTRGFVAICCFCGREYSVSKRELAGREEGHGDFAPLICVGYETTYRPIDNLPDTPCTGRAA